MRLVTVGASHRSRCNICGQVMADGRCPTCDFAAAPIARRRSWAGPRLGAVVSGAIAAVLVAWWALALVGRVSSDGARPNAGARAGAAVAITPSVTPRRLPAGVLQVNVPVDDWASPDGPPGFAFVVRSTGGYSDLLTDYHLVVAAYLDGRRDIELSDGRSRYTAHIVAVSPDPHVARLRVHWPLRALNVAEQEPPAGRPVTVEAGRTRVAGATAGVDDSVGHHHLVFRGEVLEEWSGAPVVDGSGRVVGIAEPTSQFSGGHGLGFAVPITAACAAVGC